MAMTYGQRDRVSTVLMGYTSYFIYERIKWRKSWLQLQEKQKQAQRPPQEKNIIDFIASHGALQTFSTFCS